MTLPAFVLDLADTRLGRLAVQFGKFGMVGVVGLVVDVTILYAILSTGMLGPYASRMISFLAAVSTTWALNRIFTFRGDHDGTLIGQWAKFLAANAFGGALNYATYAALVAGTAVVAEHPFLGVAIGSVVGMFLNFTASKKLVFRAV